MGVRMLLERDPKSLLFNKGTRNHVPWSAESLKVSDLTVKHGIHTCELTQKEGTNQ